jgi:tRNA threonylcarbamoyladenosine biosynthesis protein TsaE
VERRNPCKEITFRHGKCLELSSSSPEETFFVGKRVAALLSSGSVIALEGELGSGKTSFAKGIAAGLGINENLTSPTYTIINEYPGPPVLYHIDAYRLNGDRDFEDIGGNEIINSGGICIIEWGGRIPKSLPIDAITILLKITGSSSRSIKIKGVDTL